MLESVIYLYSSIDKQLVQKVITRESHVGMGAAFIVRNCARYKSASHTAIAQARKGSIGDLYSRRGSRGRETFNA